MDPKFQPQYCLRFQLEQMLAKRGQTQEDALFKRERTDFIYNR